MIRKAEYRDIPDLLDIYNDAVLSSTATFDLEPKSLEERTRWFEEHTGKYVLLVYEKEGHAVGYGGLSPYRIKEAYGGTAELSVYVDRAYWRRGIGRALVEAVLQAARDMGELHTVVSVITAGNEASTRLHEEFGFTYCGRVIEAGVKFGKYLGIDTYQMIL